MGRKVRSIWASKPAGCGALETLSGKIIETSMYLHVEIENRITKSKEREVGLRRSIK